MKKNSLEKTIVELMCISKSLGRQRSDEQKKLAFILSDTAVEIALKSYASSHGLIKIGKSNTKTISSILAKLHEQNKLVSYEKKTVLKYHTLAKNLYSMQKSASLNNKTIDDYFVLAKILLARLYDFRASKAEWQKLVNKTAKSLYPHIAARHKMR